MCEQPQYSIFARGAEAAVLPTCQRHDMGVIAWSPLAGGWLTGKYRRGVEVPAGSRYAPRSFWVRPRGGPDVDAPEDPRIDLVEQLVAVAEAAGVTMTQLGLAFVTRHPAVTSTIIGPKTMEQLDQLLDAADVHLDGDALDAIDRIMPPGVDGPGIDHFVDNPALSDRGRRR